MRASDQHVNLPSSACWPSSAAAGIAPKLQANLAEAWSWYQKGADLGEPNALAWFAERDEKNALAESSSTKRNSLLLRAFTRFAAAAKRAHDEDWPDDTWKSPGLRAGW
jgi:hypothetical protein